MPTSAFVVYADQSKTIRRIIVSDALDIDAIGVAHGEAILAIPFEEYTKKNDSEIRAFVAQKIGGPLHDCRCVEVDSRGTVVAVYVADPVIDSPFRAGNTMELHKSADIGDIKQGDVFISTKPIPPTPPIIVDPDGGMRPAGTVPI